MLITFHCTKCQAELEGDAAMAGNAVKCPQCGNVLTVPRQSLGPGFTVGGFEIIRMLGEGGMGEVYLAKQLSLGRNVALKILPAQMKLRRGVAERFFKEVHLLAQLEHPNIVMAFEAGEDAGVMYLAMGYVNGETLEQKLRRDGPMKEAEALELIGKLAGALAYAWREHQLLHRDLKPSNVMQTPSGEVKLMDFGLAKCLVEKGGLTLSGTIMGTPNYMSPEQVEGLVELDCRADLYSLGATLYHMVTGKLPFAGSSVLETLRKQVNEVLPDPRTVNPAVTENCVTLLEIMLSKKRDQRHADYQALIGDIERVRSGRPPQQERLKEGESVLLRAEALRMSKASKPGVARKQPSKSNQKIIIGAAAGAVVAIGIVVALALGLKSPRSEAVKTEGVKNAGAISAEVVKASAGPATPGEKPQPGEKLAKLTKQYLEALTFTREHPEDYAGALVLLEPLGQAAAGTELEGKVNDELGRVGRVRKQAVDQAITALKADVQLSVAAGDFDKALKRIELDTGLVTEETKAARTELARAVREKQQAADETRSKQAAEAEQQKLSGIAQEKLAALAQGFAEDLLKGDPSALAARIAAAKSDPGLGIISNEVSALNDLALQAIDWPERVAKTFEESKGKTVTVDFKGGRKDQFTVTGVAGERINGQRQMAAGFVGREFSVNDLSVAEKLKRLGADPQPATKLMRGLVYVKCANDWALAEKEFALAGGILAEALAKGAPARQAPALKTAAAKPSEKPAEKAVVEAKVEETAIPEPKKPDAGKPKALRPMTPRDAPAQQSLAAVLKMAGVTADFSNPQAAAEAVGAKELSSNTVAQIKTALADFEKKYSDTQIAQDFAVALKALGALEPELAPVALKPATEKTMIAALKELEKDNGELKSKYKLTGGGFIEQLDLTRNKNLRDLKALAGLPIINLILTWTAVKDLRPLIGMPLTTLWMYGVPVDNFNPLGKIKTLKYLDLECTGITDLSPLKGLQLTTLRCAERRMERPEGIRDLTPLADMPLEILTVRFSLLTTPKEMAVNISLLQDMHLCELSLTGPAIKDIKFLENCSSIELLQFENTHVSDLSPLRGMKSLSRLRLYSNQKVDDLSTLRGKELNEFRIYQMNIKSLEPLADKGANIYELTIASCPKLTDTDKIPEYFPNLRTVVIGDDFPRPEILTRCANLEKISLKEEYLTMEQFKKRFVKPPKQPGKK